MEKQNPKTATVQLKLISPVRPPLAIMLGSGSHHALTESRVEKPVASGSLLN